MKLRISSYMREKNVNTMQSILDLIFYMCACFAKYSSDFLMNDFLKLLNEIKENSNEKEFHQKENISRIKLLILVVGNMISTIDMIKYGILILEEIVIL